MICYVMFCYVAGQDCAAQVLFVRSPPGSGGAGRLRGPPGDARLRKQPLLCSVDEIINIIVVIVIMVTGGTDAAALCQQQRSRRGGVSAAAEKGQCGGV
jgi:hypothetical protein